MKIVKGTFNEAKVFTDNVDYACLDQLKNLLNCKAFEGEKIRIMPDCHAGAGCVVGYTQTITTGKVVSNLVGVDIGCGMSYVKIPKVDLRQLDKVIHQFIPAGFEIHKPGELPNRLVNGVIDLMDKLYAPLDETRRARIMNSIGTLGGGNHFLELDTCVETGDTYHVVHTGSRNLGLQVAKYWQSVAEKEMKNHSVDINAIVKRLKSEGRETEIESEIKKIKSQEVHVPKELSYLEGEFAERYLHDMDLCQKFAEDNRRQILTTVMGKLGVLTKKNEKSIKSTIHNYIDLTRRIIRKGAISAEANEEVLIPMNMRDGSLICIGKGNEDWNYSAPHGAGRIMSRGEAKRNVSMEDYRKSMEGIFSTSISESTIDESPMAYKPAKEIESLIGDTVEVKYHLKPVYNFKAGSEENWSR
jgi:RNA-splicing ligase RtcB